MKKQSVIDKVFRTSSNPREIYSNAFKQLPPKSLAAFGRVMYDKTIFKNTTYTKIIERENKLSLLSSLPHSIKIARDEKVFYFYYGVLSHFSEEIKKFLSIEKNIQNCLLNGNLQRADELLSHVESSYGNSFWGIQNRLILNAMRSDDLSSVSREHDSDDILSIYVKYMEEITSNMLSTEQNTVVSDIISNKDQLSSVNEDGLDVYIYRFVGYNPKIMINAFNIMKHEDRQSLIDLFKAFEIICFNVLIDNKKPESIEFREDVLKFCKNINHPFFEMIMISENDVIIDLDELSIFDHYTNGDYQSVIERLSSDVQEHDIGKIKLLSSSLSRGKFRLIPTCLYHRIVNAIADTIDKKHYFQESSALLNNVCLAFRHSLLFRIINSRGDIECSWSMDGQEALIEKVELIFSKTNTPFKISYLLGSEAAIRLYKAVDNSATFHLYLVTQGYDSNGLIDPQREMRYAFKALIEANKFNDAISLFENNREHSDCYLIKKYIYSLIMIGRKTDAALEFINASFEYPLANNYFYSNVFYEAIRNEANKASSVVIPIAIYLCRDCGVDASLNRNSVAIAIGKYIKNCRLKLPSELGFSDSDRNHVYFLSTVCSKELLCKSLLFRHQNDAYEERIRICNTLINKKIANGERLTYELMSLSKKKVFESAAKQVNKSKVYADKDYIMSIVWDEFKLIYEEYILKEKDKKSFDSMIEDVISQSRYTSTVSDAAKNMIEFFSSSFHEYLLIGKNERNRIFYNMMKVIVDEYCFGLKGLNSYLSTRVRHGTLSSTLINHMINNGLYPHEGRSDTEYSHIIQDEDESFKRKIYKYQIAFQNQLNAIIGKIVNEWVQVLVSGKGGSNSAFNFSILESDVLNVQKGLVDNPTLKECWDSIDEWINGRLNDGCIYLLKRLDNEARDEFGIAFSTFESNIDVILSTCGSKTKRSINSLVTSSKQHLFQQLNLITSWFEVDYNFYEGRFEIETAVEIAKMMLQAETININCISSFEVTQKELSPMVDILHNLIGNAIKHSNIDSGQLIVDIDSVRSDRALKLTVYNNCSFNGCIDTENSRLSEYVHAMKDEQIRAVLQKEGGSGVAKVRNIMRHEFRSDDYIELKYLSNDKFTACINFDISNWV